MSLVRKLWLLVFVPVALLSVVVSLLGIRSYIQLQQASGTAITTVMAATTSFDKACDISAVLKPWAREVVTVVRPPVDRDCQLLRSGKKSQIIKVSEALSSWTSSKSYTKWTNNCSSIVREFSNNFYISQEELDFPLAFSLTIYTDPEQVLRLLKVIYRPHNLYCVYPDAKGGEQLAGVFKKLAICLDNVFIASSIEKIYHEFGTSIINAQLSCLRDFTMLPLHKWKYVINVGGRELPLKTNREMVRSLKKLHGTSAVRTATLTKDTWDERFSQKYYFDAEKGSSVKTQETLDDPPHEIELYKSMTYIAASRPFAEFILTSEIAKAFQKYLRDVLHSHEHFYASLYRFPGAPGGFNSSLSSVPVIDNFLWMRKRERSECAGEVLRGVCVLGVSELKYITQFVPMAGGDKKSELDVFFFNKYSMERDHVVMDCMEERLLQQNLLEYRQDCEKINGA